VGGANVCRVVNDVYVWKIYASMILVDLHHCALNVMHMCMAYMCAHVCALNIMHMCIAYICTVIFRKKTLGPETNTSQQMENDMRRACAPYSVVCPSISQVRRPHKIPKIQRGVEAARLNIGSFSIERFQIIYYSIITYNIYIISFL